MSNPLRCFDNHHRYRVWLFLNLLILLLASGGSLTPLVQAQTQNPCENVVAEAQKLYGDGRFSAAISLLRPCLPNSVPEEQRVGAYRLLAHAYLAEDKREEAIEAIRKIYDLKHDYSCDATQDSQPYCDLIEEVEPTIPKPLGQKLFGGWKKVPWIAVGAIASYTIGKATFGTPPEKPLPEPPELP